MKTKRLLKNPWFILFIITVLLNIFSWVIPGFADVYALHVFPVWVNTLGRITTLSPISVGEIMIILGILIVILFIISQFTKLKNIFRFIIGRLLIIIFMIMTLNCFINYHTTPISVDMNPDGRQYLISELAELRDYIVTKCNELAPQMDRDEKGNVIIEGKAGRDADDIMEQRARDAMAKLGDRFPRLDGYYVTPKALYFSGFVSQQYMQGYYFPFSMEANYNQVMYIMNKPFTMCHELAHTRSYIYEDEANFIGYLACVNSDDITFNYSGYLGVLNYVNNAFYENVSKDEYLEHVKISDEVRHDNIFLTKENWKKVEDNAVLDTELVKKSADTFVDTTLKVNGVSDGKASYDRVVELLLDEYFLKEK